MTETVRNKGCQFDRFCKIIKFQCNLKARTLIHDFQIFSKQIIYRPLIFSFQILQNFQQKLSCILVELILSIIQKYYQFICFSSQIYNYLQLDIQIKRIGEEVDKTSEIFENVLNRIQKQNENIKLSKQQNIQSLYYFFVNYF
ncbi:unnamed protein product (macronuclear) [Paramecium tetraurelia]|uniref:Transmembrane protein n=1 Tax=Paramecium tetraurelia TaxID=5888 RepID=A0DQD2_PARTE|nr:uncharacterized protein GSPATT00002649001 [Paramecium tetraurelia]CAK85249.1 unnamed protein product [Paramecium tetraurelia]|eukprot:XP_001452646.1 hypothetical protein (macronuclear) [Paramecium tetraurelia strain d4-2]